MDRFFMNSRTIELDDNENEKDSAHRIYSSLAFVSVFIHDEMTKVCEFGEEVMRRVHLKLFKLMKFFGKIQF